ncbi:MAG: DUF1345 domain-containing protein [Actinomycetota bacterium]
MKSNTVKPRVRWPKPIRIVLVRPKLLASLLFGVAVSTLTIIFNVGWSTTHQTLWWVPHVLLGWDMGLALYLTLVYWMFLHPDIDHIRRQSALQDEGRISIAIVTVLAALTSIAGIVYWLSETRQPADLTLVLLTVPLSWTFIHTIFALHYAHEFYAEHRGSCGGLNFPDDPRPDYWDFVYFSFGIGMAAQVADVTVTAKPIRHVVTIHSIVSFVFNVTLIALMVSIVGDAITGNP